MLLFLFGLVSQLADASCVTANFSTSTLDFCDGIVTTITSGRTEQEIMDWVVTEALVFTDGVCTGGVCTLEELQGTALQSCFDSMLDLLCKYAAGPDLSSESSACADSAALVPLVTDCQAVEVTCAATYSGDDRSYCQDYVCVSCENGGTCASPFADGYDVCTCTEDFHGVACDYAYLACEEADNGFVCSGHGTCDNFAGTCLCESEWDGATCSSVSCLKEGEDLEIACNGRGICHPVGVCQCDAGWIGTSCTLQISDEGMTSGEFAGAVIGGLIVSFLVVGLSVYLYVNDPD